MRAAISGREKTFTATDSPSSSRAGWPITSWPSGPSERTVVGGVAEVPAGDARPFDRGVDPRHRGPHPSADEVAHGVEVLADGHDLVAVVHDGERDPEVWREPGDVEIARRHARAGALRQVLGHHLDEVAVLEPDVGGDGPSGVGHRGEEATHRLGRQRHQRLDQFASVAGDLPVEVPRLQPVEHRHGHVDGDAVEICPRVVAVGERELEVALAPGVGEGGRVVTDAVVGEVGGGDGEQVGLVAPGLLPPPVEVPTRHDALGEPPVVEAEPRRFVEQVGPAQAVAEVVDAGDEGIVVGEEPVPGIPFAPDEGVLHEQVAGVRPVDPVVADLATGHEG